MAKYYYAPTRTFVLYCSCSFLANMMFAVCSFLTLCYCIKSGWRSVTNDSDNGKVYAVAVGRIPGIYHHWADAERQVLGYSCPLHKSFTSMGKAISFMNQHVQPGAWRIYSNSHKRHNRHKRHKPVSNGVAAQATPADSGDKQIVCASGHQTYNQLVALITADASNEILDPSWCDCALCPYSTGDLRSQRYSLMVRLHQLNLAIDALQKRRDYGA